MSVACKPIIPVGVLTDKNRPSAIDFDVLSSAFENPILRYDDKQVRLITILTNSLLEIAKNSISQGSGSGAEDTNSGSGAEDTNSGSDTILSQYPDLENRYIENGSLSESEISEFILDSGMLPGYIEETYRTEFPIDINIGAVNEAINEIENSLEESLEQIRRDNQSSSIPIPPDDLTNQNFNESFISTDPVSNWTPEDNISNLLSQMNSFYKKPYTETFRNTNKCSGIANPFDQLSSLIASVTGLIQTGKEITSFASKLPQLVSDTITRVFNFPEYIVRIATLSSNLETMKQDLLNLVNGVVSDMKLKVDSIRRTVNSILGQPGTSKGSIKFFTKKLRQVENFLSDTNVDQIKAKVKSVLTANEDQFEDLLPAVLQFLSLKVCGITNFLENLIKKPIDELNRLLSQFSLNKNILENYSTIKTNRVLDAGGIRIGADVREQERTSHAKAANRISSSGTSDEDLIPSKSIKLHITSEELEFVNSLTADYNDLFRFETSVKNMGSNARDHYKRNGSNSSNWSDTENKDDSGWKVVAEQHPYIYAALARVSKRLRDQGLLSGPLIINSAYRSRYYNREVISGGAFHSFHMQGMALDIGDKASGLTARGSSKFLDYASEEGFTRVGVYGSFIHIDVSEGGPSVFRLSRSNSGITAAVERHKQRRSRV